MIEQILFSLAVLLILAKLLGEITERLGITALVGQLFAGVIVGPVLHIIVIDSFLGNFVDLGIIFVLFLAGLGVNFHDFKENIYMAAALAIAGGLVAFLLGFMVGFLVFNNILVGIAIGMILVTTADSILFTIMAKKGIFKTKTGKLIIATTIADDVLGILALSFFNFFITQQSIEFWQMFQLFLIAVGFYMIILYTGSRVVNKILDVAGNLIDEQILFSIPVGIVLILAFVSENIGLGMATGAFLGGMIMSRHKFTGGIIEPKVKVVADGFIIPLFYASVGTLLILNDLNPLLILLFTAVAILGKYMGVYLMGTYFHLDSSEKKLLGVSMIPRGDYNIALAQIAMGLGIFVAAPSAYTSIIFAIVLTIIITPIILKAMKID